MSDSEFDLLDELYFVQEYSYLKDTLGWEDLSLMETLTSLYHKGMIKCLSGPDDERFDQVDIFAEGKRLFFLATKKGLMAHNTL
jgi:DNA-binding MarR family transcriptional regulator